MFNSIRIDVVSGGKGGSKETFMNAQRSLFRNRFTRSRCHFFKKILKIYMVLIGVSMLTLEEES